MEVTFSSIGGNGRFRAPLHWDRPIPLNFSVGLKKFNPNFPIFISSYV